MSTSYGAGELQELAETKPAAPRKRGWLPLLTVLFLISYGLMTMLIVEQGQTIESQRALIRELFRDSTELSAVKLKEQQRARKAQTAGTQNTAPATQAPSATQVPSVQGPLTQVPTTQVPSAQAPPKQAPSAQAVPQHRSQNQTAKEKPFRTPSKPASDPLDGTRSLRMI